MTFALLLLTLFLGLLFGFVAGVCVSFLMFRTEVGVFLK